MIQAKTPFQMKLPYEISLHLFTFVCLYFSLVLRHHSLISGISLFLLANITILSIFRLKEGFWPSLRQIIIIAQGYLVFLPLAIFSDMLLAFAIGISIHYLQYLSISWKLCKVGFGFSMKIVLLVLLTYKSRTSPGVTGFRPGTPRFGWIEANHPHIRVALPELYLDVVAHPFVGGLIRKGTRYML